MDNNSHKVHFSENTDILSSSLIQVRSKGSLHFEAHVGFLQSVSDGMMVQVEFFAHKEKLLRESFFVKGASNETVKVTVFARVLGKGKGTPMLRDGITCIASECEDESEASDWQGFE